MNPPTPPKRERLFEIEVQDETLILIPWRSLREVDYLEIEASTREILDYLASTKLKNLVVDVGRMDYSSSTALGLFIRLAKAARSRHGRMAFCNVSAYEKEILHITHLDEVWPIYPSRQEAFDAVRG
jgi:anti-anti-sigma factor